jgi:hypothetical protein
MVPSGSSPTATIGASTSRSGMAIRCGKDRGDGAVVDGIVSLVSFGERNCPVGTAVFASVVGGRNSRSCSAVHETGGPLPTVEVGRVRFVTPRESRGESRGDSEVTVGRPAKSLRGAPRPPAAKAMPTPRSRQQEAPSTTRGNSLDTRRGKERWLSWHRANVVRNDAGIGCSGSVARDQF